MIAILRDTFFEVIVIKSHCSSSITCIVRLARGAGGIVLSIFVSLQVPVHCSSTDFMMFPIPLQ